MSKINTLMDTLRRVIRGNDRSDTPQLRKLAATYASACQETAAALAECRNLLAAGLGVDAQNINRAMTPPLAERARVLMLSAEDRAIWLELCRLYHYPEAAELDAETVKRLSGGPGAETGDAGRLIMRWRKIARSGSNAEKRSLLRSIIRAVPDHNAIWRDNLRQVEQRWVAELLNDLPRILKANDAPEIMKLFQALTDPELSVKVPEEALTRLRPFVTQIQKEELAAKQRRQLEAIAAAYSALDEAGTRSALAEYEKLVSHPLYAPDPEEKRQIGEVRRYLDECTRRAAELARARQETAELQALLNDNGPLDRINQLYESLRQLDVPLNQTLSERVENRRAEAKIESERRYRRRGLLAILAAILLLAAGALSVLAVNVYSENRNMAEAWEKQLAENNPAAVLEMYEKIKREKPRLLKFGRLRALQMEAERLEKERTQNTERLMALLGEAETLAEQGEDGLAELAERMDALKKLPENALTPESETRLRRVSAAYRTLKLQHQQRRDREFLTQWTALTARCLAWEQAIHQPERDCGASEAESQRIFADGEALFRNADAVSAPVRDARRENWLERRKIMEKLLTAERELRAFRKNLLAPESFASYVAALEKLPVRSPQEATGGWKKALAMLPATRALALSADYGSRWESSEKFDDRAREIQPFARTTPFVDDVRTLLPDHFAEQRAVQELELAKRFCSVPDCYEIVLSDADGKRYFFYAPDLPKRETKRSSPIPKSIMMNILYQKNSATAVPLLLRITAQGAGKLTFQPHKFTALSLPEEFYHMENMDIASKIFPRSPHRDLMADLQQKVKSAATPEELEKTVLAELAALQKRDSMNLLLRASLMRQLLDTLSVTSAFYPDVIMPIAAQLDALALGHYDTWMVPNAEAGWKAAPELRGFLQKLDLVRLREARLLEQDIFTSALERGIAPAGIVIAEADGRMRIHWFGGADACREVWLSQTEEKSGQIRFFMMPRQTLEKGDVLPADWRSAATPGMVIFAPFDGRDTRQLAEDFLTRARTAGVSEIRWPESWPVNCRNGKNGD